MATLPRSAGRWWRPWSLVPKSTMSASPVARTEGGLEGRARIVEQGFNIKRGQEEAFQKWTEETDELTRKASPPGVEYLGTYLVWFSSEKETGEYRVLWRIDSMAAFETMEEAARGA